MNISGVEKRTRIKRGILFTSGSFLHKEDQAQPWNGRTTRMVLELVVTNRSTSVRSISVYKPSPCECTCCIVVKEGSTRAILLSIESKCPLMARLLTISAIMH